MGKNKKVTGMMKDELGGKMRDLWDYIQKPLVI